jgi:hypothetical protein
MGLSEKRLLRRVSRFIPPGASVLAVEIANANPIDEQHRPTPVVLTDRGLLLITSTGATGIVTDVPFTRVSEARSEGTVLHVSFRDEGNRPRALEADFRQGGAELIERFLDDLRSIQPGLSVDEGRVPMGTYHAAWDRGRGATFDVFENDGRRHIRPTYDPGVAGLQASELCKQAMMDLSRAIAEKPELVWVRTKPEWMPEFVWTPPLPSVPTPRARP